MENGDEDKCCLCPVLCLWNTWDRLVSDLPPSVLQQSPFGECEFQLRAQHLVYGDFPPSLPACENRVSLCVSRAATKQRAQSCLCLWPLAFLLHHFPAFLCRASFAFRGGKEAVTLRVLQTAKPLSGERRDRTTLASASCMVCYYLRFSLSPMEAVICFSVLISLCTLLLLLLKAAFPRSSGLKGSFFFMCELQMSQTPSTWCRIPHSNAD